MSDNIDYNDLEEIYRQACEGGPEPNLAPCLHEHAHVRIDEMKRVVFIHCDDCNLHVMTNPAGARYLGWI